MNTVLNPSCSPTCAIPVKVPGKPSARLTARLLALYTRGNTHLRKLQRALADRGLDGFLLLLTGTAGALLLIHIFK